MTYEPGRGARVRRSLHQTHQAPTAEARCFSVCPADAGRAKEVVVEEHTRARCGLALPSGSFRSGAPVRVRTPGLCLCVRLF